MNDLNLDSWLKHEKHIFDHERWSSSLSLLMQRSDALYSHVLLFDENVNPISGIVTSRLHNADDAEKAHLEYLDYSEKDLRTQSLFTKPTNIFFNHKGLVGQEKLKASAVYNEYLVKHHAESQVLCNLGACRGKHLLWAMIRS